MKPKALGYHLVAEWELHESTWLSWPNINGCSFPNNYEKVCLTFIEIIKELATSEIVRINVSNTEDEKKIHSLLSPVAPMERIEFYHHPTNEPWCRDHGPIFIKNRISHQLAINNFNYNAWGNKYPPFDQDNAIPLKIAHLLNYPIFYPNIVLEGGSIDCNGRGAILTTESVLLNLNRNPTLLRSDIEQCLIDFLGIEQIIWLKEGIEGDDTDGHIDDITRFVSWNTVVTAVEKNKADPNHEILKQNYDQLKQVVLTDGGLLEIIEIPMPPYCEDNGIRLPASYANFYIANTVILLPTFHSKNDEIAVSIFSDLFPNHRIVPIDSRELIIGLGSFHCLTQQQPC